MLKNKLKVLVLILIMVLTISTFCLATGDVVDVQLPEEGETLDEDILDFDNMTEEELEALLSGYDSSGSGVPSDFQESDIYEVSVGTVNIEKWVDGNVFVIAKEVNLAAGVQIGGDMFVIAETVLFDSETYVYGNTFIIANNFYIGGATCDVYGIVNNFNLEENGAVLRDCKVVTQSANIAGSVGRHVMLESKNFTIAETAMIYGNLEYTAKEPVQITEGSVTGEIIYSEPTVTTKNFGTKLVDYAIDLAGTLVTTLVIFGILLLLAPKFVQKTPELVKEKWHVSLGFGLLALVAVPIAAIILMVTVIGTSIAFTVLSAYMLVASVAYAITAIALGNFLGSKVKALEKFKNVFAIIITTIVLWILMQIPFVGLGVSLLSTIFGLGILVTSFMKKKEKPVVTE